MRNARAGLAAAVSLAGVILCPGGAHANDSTAAFGAGGLQFEQTDKVRMEREDLYLSPREVRVSYVFRNLTETDVQARVGFPMPEIDVFNAIMRHYQFHKSDRDGDVFDFHVEVNGRPVTAEYDARGYIRKVGNPELDVTELLKKHKVALIDPRESVDKDAMAELLTVGVYLRSEELGLGNGQFYPSWFVRASFHWTQMFPARQQVRITHRYKPVLGSSAMYSVNEIKATEPSAGTGEWCADQAFLRALKKLPADPINNALLTTWLEYVLKTGANWAGPIGKFRLEIDKAGADLVSLCPIPGLKVERRGQSFVAEAAQYAPTRDIKLLFVYRACDKAPCGRASWPGYPR
jgi:hypothetical protein